MIHAYFIIQIYLFQKYGCCNHTDVYRFKLIWKNSAYKICDQ